MSRTTVFAATCGAAGVFAGAALLSLSALSSMRKRLRRIEEKLHDAETRIGLLEYNHLHENGQLKIPFGCQLAQQRGLAVNNNPGKPNLPEKKFRRGAAFYFRTR